MAKAGRPPNDPMAIIAYETIVTDEGTVRQPVRVVDRVEATLRANGFLHDAAARAGTTPITLRSWRAKGNRAQLDLTAGRRKLSDLTAHDRHCIELAERMELAEAEARLELIDVLTRLAVGGATVTEVTIRVGSDGNEVDRRTKTSTMLPDGRAVTWLLSHRYPALFAGRVEVTGPDGGPIQTDIASPLDRLVAKLGRVGARLDDDVHGNGEVPVASNGE